MKNILTIYLVLFFIGCTPNDNGSTTIAPPPNVPLPQKPATSAPTLLPYKVLNVYNHDTSAYTQGLEFYNGKLYESTGDYQNSSLRITNVKTGKVEQKNIMGTPDIFGEGITILNNKIYQLTWQNKKVFVYNINNIKTPIQTFNWPYEGWGITHNNNQLYISDGTENIYIVDPQTFRVNGTLSVNSAGTPEPYLNELEFIDGFIYANVYQTNYILKIDATNGNVVSKINLTGLKENHFAKEYVEGHTDVLNGIAYDSTTKKIFITGKHWPKMFEVTFGN
jgi:glutaminyl-peptide cyclotransferase